MNIIKKLLPSMLLWLALPSAFTTTLLEKADHWFISAKGAFIKQFSESTGYAVIDDNMTSIKIPPISSFYYTNRITII